MPASSDPYLPEIMELRPSVIPDSTPRCRSSEERRRSASSKSTFEPRCASVMARLQLETDLPSLGNPLVTTRTWGGRSEAVSKSELQSTRYDSARSDEGRCAA